MARALGERQAEIAGEARALPVASHERGIQAAGHSVRRRIDGHESVRRHRVALAFQLERLCLVDDDRVSYEGEAGCSDEDLAGRGGLFETGCHVDCVTRDERFAFAGHDLAGVHAGPERQGDPELFAERDDPIADFAGCSDGSERVILVRAGDPEDGHDGVSDELLDGSPMVLDDAANLFEVTAHRSTQRLGVELLAERRRTTHVAEEHRYRLGPRVPPSRESGRHRMPRRT